MELFLNDELNEKGFAILYQKINYNKNPKSIELAFLNKKINKQEIQNLSTALKKYNIENTQLVIKQDTTDIKKFILENNATEKAKENEKDLMILNLENKLKQNTYNNKALREEIIILFLIFPLTCIAISTSSLTKALGSNFGHASLKIEYEFPSKLHCSSLK